MIIPENFLKILSKSPTHNLIVQDVIFSFKPILEDNKLFFFEEYTDHGIRHIENVLESAQFIISEESYENITASEVCILILSIILHDLGMHLEYSSFNAMLNGDYDKFIVKELDLKTWDELWQDYLSEVKRFSSSQKRNIFGDETIAFKLPDLSNKDLLSGYDKKLIGEFIRRHHARLAHEIAFAGLFGSSSKINFGSEKLDNTYRELAGILARSHGMSLRNTFPYLEKIGHSSWRNPHDINIIFLMIVLRIADYVQIDSSRTNKYLIKLKSFNSPISLIEHNTHLSISSISFNQPDNERIYVNCSPQNSEMYVKIKNLLDDIQKELDISWATLGEVYGFIPNKKPSIKFRRITSNLKDLSYLKTINFIPQQVSFKVDNNLSKLLVAPLYGNNPKYGVRELLQNSIDACLERGEMESKLGNKNYGALIEISISKIDENFSLFKIKDNGKGMSENEIINYFLNVGTSFRKSLSWKKEFINDHGKTTINRNGKFGIGVLASFLLGDEIKVKSKYLSKDITYEFYAKIDSEFIDIQKDITDFEVGTLLEIKVNNQVRDKLLSSETLNWKNWYIYNYPKIIFSIENNIQDEIKDFQDTKFYSFGTENFEKIEWKYFTRETTYGKTYDTILACNGIIITKNLSGLKDKFLYPGKSNSFYRSHAILQKPSMLITDKEGIFPLKLDRNDIDTIELPFEKELLIEVSKKYIADILSIQLQKNEMSNIELPHNGELLYGSEGYILDFDYFLDGIIKNYRLLRIIVEKDNFRCDLSEFKKCFFYIKFNERINLTYQERNVSPMPSGRVVLGKHNFDNLFLSDKKRLPNYIRKSVKIEDQNKSYVIYNINSFDSEPILLKNINSIPNTLLKETVSVQEIGRDFFKMKGEVILNKLLKKYIGENFVIPYDIEQRKVLFSKAFKELKNFMP